MIFSIVISIVSALIFSILLLYVFNRRAPGPGNGIWFILLIIFMFAWVGGSRLATGEPGVEGRGWLNYAGVAFIITLLLAAILPRSPKRGANAKLTTEEVKAEVEVQMAIGITFGIFFWILIITLLILGIAGAFYTREPLPMTDTLR